LQRKAPIPVEHRGAIVARVWPLASLLVDYFGLLMTEEGDPAARRQAYVSRPVTPRGKTLAPNPGVRRAIVAAASKSVRARGLRGLSVAAVLEEARLSTRAFYRHFDSKDELVAAVFVEMARAEVLRLRRKMANTAGPVEALAAWIGRRLGLAFDEQITAFR
jgi:AcrR family transcriptional regulator